MTRVQRLIRDLGAAELARRIGTSASTVRRWSRDGVPKARTDDLRAVERRREAAQRAATTRKKKRRKKTREKRERSKERKQARETPTERKLRLAEEKIRQLQARERKRAQRERERAAKEQREAKRAERARREAELIAQALSALTVDASGKVKGPVTREGIQTATSLASQMANEGFRSAAAKIRDYLRTAEAMLAFPVFDDFPRPGENLQEFRARIQREILDDATRERYGENRIERAIRLARAAQERAVLNVLYKPLAAALGVDASALFRAGLGYAEDLYATVAA